MPSGYSNTGMSKEKQEQKQNKSALSLEDKDREFIWHPYTTLAGQRHIAVKSAKSVYLYTEDGRQIIDAISSWWVNIHGHSNEYIAEALSEQARKLEHVIFAGFTHEPAVRLAERLLDILPGPQSRIFYSDNGSTAVESALKIAFQFRDIQGKPKRKILAIEGAFHGDTFGAMAVGARSEFSRPFHPLLFEAEFIPFPSEGQEESSLRKMEALAGDPEIAAFIYEPLVQGAAGMRMYSAEFLDKLIRIAKDNELVCIADEVMTGFGRTGTLFASDQTREKPDIICLSKALTGGTMPLGVTACNEKIVKAFEHPEKKDIKQKTFFHGHSFTANPLACVVSNASLDLLLENSCQEKIKQICEWQMSFKQRIEKHPLVRKVSVQGTILSLEILSENTGYFNELRDKLYNFFLDRDILLRPLGNVVYVLPPYVITRQELQKVYQAIEDFLEKHNI